MVNNINPNINTNLSSINKPNHTSETGQFNGKLDFSKTVKDLGKYVSEVDQQQQDANISVKDMLAGKNDDVTSVVSQVAKSDMSFKLLVGVRNKLIQAYKSTMNMPI